MAMAMKISTRCEILRFEMISLRHNYVAVCSKIPIALNTLLK